MIIFQSTKQAFIDQVMSGVIDSVLVDFYYKATRKHVSPSEQDSWRHSMRYMRDVLNDGEIPDDAGVSIEYQIPLTAKRIDFILSGQNDRKVDHAILIELKQWSSARLSEKDGIVFTDFFGEVSHPSYQVWSYAALIENFCETVEKDKVQLKPCAYLHNYIEDDVIKNVFYADYLSRAPVFLEGDAEKVKLQKFIKQFVKFGDRANVMYRIDGGRLRPSKSLTDGLAGMMKGNQEFFMIDDQKVVYETALALAEKSTPQNKNVLIVQGGPGTGKSVVAINLLVEITKRGYLTQYVTKNAAPRAVYESLLTGTYRRTQISNLFTGSGSFIEIEKNSFDALVVDEAHRLNEKSGMYSNLGENQIKEIIDAAKCSIFFIDENQKVTWKDIGEEGEIEKWAKKCGANVQKVQLSSQFRCNGSDGYLAWLDNALQIHETANPIFDDKSYDFQVLNSPKELRELIFEKNKQRNRARLVAGYCWNWVSRRNKDLMDIEIPEYDFSMKWNLASEGNLWIRSTKSVNEVGCIHTCQGLEMDYVGVIVGPDLIVRDDKVITNPAKRARTDASLKGFITDRVNDPEKASKKADLIIKNTYRTLMTRGMKGCYVFFSDKETERYFQTLLSRR